MRAAGMPMTQCFLFSVLLFCVTRQYSKLCDNATGTNLVDLERIRFMFPPRKMPKLSHLSVLFTSLILTCRCWNETRWWISCSWFNTCKISCANEAKVDLVSDMISQSAQTQLLETISFRRAVHRLPTKHHKIVNYIGSSRLMVPMVTVSLSLSLHSLTPSLLPPLPLCKHCFPLVKEKQSTTFNSVNIFLFLCYWASL